MRLFFRAFAISKSSDILDLGGDPKLWIMAREMGLHAGRIFMVNLYYPAEWKPLPKDICWIIADARALPFRDKQFDVVFSNSLIEHLGTYSSQQKFADETARVAERFFVQTPNRRFPIEPHYWAPFIHWMPKALQVRLLRYFTLWGWLTRPSRERCAAMVEELHLLNQRELQKLFPSATVIVERFLGLRKSLIATRGYQSIASK